MKKTFLLVLMCAAFVPSLFSQQGTPVKNLHGAGPPGPSVAQVVGTTYIDDSVTPPIVYTCTSASLTPTSSACTWTLSIGGSIADTQVAVGTAGGTIGNDGNLIWAPSEEDPPRKKLTVQGGLGVLRPYNYTNLLNSTWSIDFSGHQANAATASFGDVQATVIANTNGAVSGQLDIHTRNAGALVTALSLAKDGTATSPALALTPILVGALPAAAAGNKGQMRSVSDSTAIGAEGQTCVGGSTNAALAFSNGTVWKCF